MLTLKEFQNEFEDMMSNLNHNCSYIFTSLYKGEAQEVDETKEQTPYSSHLQFLHQQNSDLEHIAEIVVGIYTFVCGDLGHLPPEVESDTPTPKVPELIELSSNIRLKVISILNCLMSIYNMLVLDKEDKEEEKSETFTYEERNIELLILLKYAIKYSNKIITFILGDGEVEHA